MKDRILTIENLRLSFPIYQGEVSVLNNVSMHINRGEIVGVVGESGSGKSVTAMLSMRLIPQDTYQINSGKLEVLGRDVLNASEVEMREMRGDKVAMIFQEPMTALNPTRRIGKQMVDVIRQHRSLNQKQASARAVELLSDMQIADPANVMDRYPFELSGGMRQRVMIALAFSCDPDLLIADEPTTALDVTVQRQVLRLLKQKARSTGTAVLFISHDMAVVSQVCDRLYVMYAGSVIESGLTNTVLTKPLHPYSAGLLECTPDGSEPRSELASIPGTVPNLAKLPVGCAFRDRCFAAGEACSDKPSLRRSVNSERQVACWYPQQEDANV
ncbi:ABC transporter ATP-binding protein [Pantoea osteomyelitidis]|uniref:ABC transporter ATP-binding protein n=1 Tax=Pantoea osteomyelitidis TaxID=3230026 RepID=A0ABW7Q192_9GAMM